MSPNYEKRVAEEKALSIAAELAEMKELEEKLRKWEEEEERVREEMQLRKTLLKELEEKNEKERIEKIEAEKQLAEEEEEKKRRIRDCLHHFATGVIDVLPDDMIVSSETQPGKETCPFFHKVAACRFWDTCSRNHIRPAVSKVLLFPGFYTHCSMSQLGQAEYDTDMSLEYDDKETYSHFVEFYEDIRAEFEKCGRLTHLFVCSNRELHLRGNVYVSYATEKEAMSAFLKFNGRYYAGKVISCLFVNIPTWKSAVCGLYFKQKCPKGDACNFLHVFKDPGPPFYEPNQDRSSSDEWRWSVSPEADRPNGHEAAADNVGRRNNRKNRRNRSIQHRQSRSAEQRMEYGSKSHCRRSVSRDEEHLHNRKRPAEQKNHQHSEKLRRSSSKDRHKRYFSDKKYSDKSSSRWLNEKRTRNDERIRSRSPQRDAKKRNRFRKSRCAGSYKHKYNERKRNKSDSSSISSESSSSDNETTSDRSRMIVNDSFENKV